MEKQTTARFFRKPAQISDLRDETPIIKPAPFRIVREIILPESRYRRFQSALLTDQAFIASRTDLTGYDPDTGCFRCLLVTSRKSRDGILVDSEGYPYARYAAYVNDKRALDLQGIARDTLDRKPRER